MMLLSFLAERPQGSRVTTADKNAADLDIHPASPAEREASFHNTHDVWSRGLPLAEHVAFRMQSPLHGRAQWFVGCLGGRVVTSLAVHPLEYQLRGQHLRGFAIGSVHTLKEFRRRGFAPRLLAWVEEYRRQLGDQLSLLYSDIDPEFYATLGYQLAPAFSGWCDREQQADLSRPLAVMQPDDNPHLERFDGRQGLAAMAKMYQSFHSSRPLSIVRSPEYWAHLFERQPTDEYYWIATAPKKAIGYVRLKPKGDDLHLVDFGFADPPVTEMVLQLQYAMLFRLLVEHAFQRGAARIGGWLPDSPIARHWFKQHLRPEEIPMFKPLDAAVTLDAESIAGTDCFCELDHV